MSVVFEDSSYRLIAITIVDVFACIKYKITTTFEKQGPN